MLLMCDSLIIFFSISPIISLYLSAVVNFVFVNLTAIQLLAASF